MTSWRKCAKGVLTVDNSPQLMETSELFTAYRSSGDTKLRDEIVERYVYIAKIIANKFVRNRRSYNNGIDYDDVYQVACLGLIYAAERFNEEKGVKFTTFATKTIVGEIQRYFRERGMFIHVPHRLYEVFMKAERIKRSESETTSEDLARILGVSEDTLKEAYMSGGVSFVRSLESELLGDDERPVKLMDTIGYEDSSFLVIENSDFIDYCRKQLSDEENKFVEMRYYDGMSQKAIGESMGMSQMQVSRLEKKILKKLRFVYFGD